MKACILIKSAPGRQSAVSEAVEQLPGVRVAFPIQGRTDVVASVSVTSFQDLVRLIEETKGQDGVVATETLVEMEAMQ
ncbi:MAG: Lrp/AsnC ligand binding domain-containing protein [Acidobacteria bacterium]|nr:Lrp/AsnC ligand binding domain-containing protein [Acidobacteriota bacterium]